MNRFVAMLWDVRFEGRTQQVCAWTEALQKASAAWHVVVDAAGFRVLVLGQRTGRPIITNMDGTDGVIIGPLFERGFEKLGRLTRLDSKRASEIVASGGGALIKAFWGNYVAFWRDPRSNTTHVLRDPCGAASCFRMQAASIEVIFSYVADIAELPSLRFSIDWDYLQAFLLHNYVRTPRTGLQQVSELMPGERVEWRSDGSSEASQVWNAATVAAIPNRQSFAEARAELRQTAEACFAAWGKAYRSIVVRISGGLDSSLAVNLLRHVSDARITGFHIVGRGYEGYELKLARQAAAKAGIELVEIALPDQFGALQSIVAEPLLPRPSRQILGINADMETARICSQTSADCVMAGHGGDSLFLQGSLASNMFADYVHMNGFDSGFWRAAYAASSLLEQSIWQVIGSGSKFAIGRRRYRPFDALGFAKQNPYRLLTLQAIDGVSSPFAPGAPITDVPKLPPCKAEQVQAIAALSAYQSVRGLGVELDAINPLISQPIVDFALRTPTYVLGGDGLDRALERRTFADLLPDSIVRRVGKGFINHQLISMIQQNTSFVKELALRGELINQPWIERDNLEKSLSGELTIGRNLHSVLNIVVVEAWLLSWRRAGLRSH